MNNLPEIFLKRLRLKKVLRVIPKAKKILENFEDELKNFKQVCPIEMLDKLDNPISLKPHIKKAG